MNIKTIKTQFHLKKIILVVSVFYLGNISGDIYATLGNTSLQEEILLKEEEHFQGLQVSNEEQDKRKNSPDDTLLSLRNQEYLNKYEKMVEELFENFLKSGSKMKSYLMPLENEKFSLGMPGVSWRVNILLSPVPQKILSEMEKSNISFAEVCNSLNSLLPALRKEKEKVLKNLKIVEREDYKYKEKDRKAWEDFLFYSNPVKEEVLQKLPQRLTPSIGNIKGYTWIIEVLSKI
jgi:hypothetical protein